MRSDASKTAIAQAIYDGGSRVEGSRAGRSSQLRVSGPDPRLTWLVDDRGLHM